MKFLLEKQISYTIILIVLFHYNGNRKLRIYQEAIEILRNCSYEMSDFTTLKTFHEKIKIAKKYPLFKT